jgi:hypothetical protein
VPVKSMGALAQAIGSNIPVKSSFIHEEVLEEKPYKARTAG